MNARSLGFLLCGVTLLVVALSTGAAIYYLLLFAMLMMLGLGALSVLMALFTVRVEMDAPKRKLTRGQGAPLTVRVRYYSFLPVRSFQLVMRVPEDDRAHETMEVSLAPFMQKEFKYELPCPHIGVFHVGVAGVRACDIFQLFSFTRGLAGHQALLEIHPSITKLPPMELHAGDSETSKITRMTEDTASPSDVRGYRAGDPLKRIHWKLSVRKRELMVRTYEESTRPDTLILPDLSPINFMRSQALTLMDAIRETAASVALAQLSAGYPVRMPLMCERPSEISGINEHASPPFLDALMRVSFDSPYPYDQVLALEMRRMQRTGGAVLITSRLTPRTCEVAEHLRRYGMQVSVCWITETHRSEAMEMLQRLKLMGIQAHRIDPWDKGLNEESLQVSYG